jgi:hypothetical protein
MGSPVRSEKVDCLLHSLLIRQWIAFMHPNNSMVSTAVFRDGVPVPDALMQAKLGWKVGM